MRPFAGTTGICLVVVFLQMLLVQTLHASMPAEEGAVAAPDIPSAG